MSKYNIALLHYSCPPVVGGVEEIISQQASLLTRYYHKVKVFVGDGGKFATNCEIEINPLLGSRNDKILDSHWACREGDNGKMEGLANDIYRYMKGVLKDFDALIAHNVLTMPFNLPLSAALHRIGHDGLIPVISWNHDSPYFYPGYPDYLELFPWNILKRAYAGLYYVAISESRKEMFARLYKSKKHLYVIPNGIDPINFFRLDSSTVRLILENNLFESEFVMIQPSRLHPRKNMELSIKVTKALHDQGVRARLLITGAHDPHEAKSLDYYNSLKQLASELGIGEDVFILAEHTFESGEKLPMDWITIRDLYLIADLIFLPSLQEGFGIPLLESGMIKLPIVCSNIPPFIEIGGDDVCLFDLSDSPDSIAHKIRQFMEELRPHKMFRKVIRNYVWDHIYSEKLLPFLDHVIEHSQKAKNCTSET